jgi:hypothetical protein
LRHRGIFKAQNPESSLESGRQLLRGSFWFALLASFLQTPILYQYSLSLGVRVYPCHCQHFRLLGNCRKVCLC